MTYDKQTLIQLLREYWIEKQAEGEDWDIGAACEYYNTLSYEEVLREYNSHIVVDKQ
jgi:hypothetical protein